ncbi:MAG: LemA family protein [Clostridiales bacterium]|nr:LemA family protein [Clostridiales bacterium]
MLIGFIIIVVIIFMLASWFIKTFNRFRRMAVKIAESESGIDVALTKRYDTLTKMLDVCRQYAIHEVETFGKIVGLRQGMTMAQRSEVSAQMDELTRGLNLVAEAYPELKSAAVFSDLQDGIRDAEAHLQAARRFYNSNVSAFNQLLVTWPCSIIGKKYTPYSFFEAQDSKRADVSMKL